MDIQIKMLGQVRTNVKMGDLALDTIALVADEIPEIYLGLDWVRKHKVNWDFDANEITIYGRRYTMYSKGELGGCRRCIVMRDTCVPPRSEANFSAEFKDGRAPEKGGVEWVTEPREIKAGLIVGRTILPKRIEDLPIRVLNLSDTEVFLKKGDEVAEASPVEVRGVPTVEPSVRDFEYVDGLLDAVHDSVSVEEKDKLKEILHEFSGAFSASEFDLGNTPLASHTIDTGDSRPIKQMLRPQPRVHVEIIDKQVDEMLKSGIIEKSCSPWVSNVVIVTKKDGSSRFCVDYRKLNEATRKDAYPLPRIDTCLDALGGSKIFSTFDLRSGYHQVPMDPIDADKTSFVTRKGTFKFSVLPFGLCNAGATFQRVMDVAMAGLNFDICLIYLDDIILFSKTVDEHLTRLKSLLGRLIAANLKLKPSKCKLLQREVSFLGHIVSDKGVGTDPEKLCMVRDWPVPTNVSEVRSFLGLASYYRKFVLGFASIAAPLHALTSKLSKFAWTAECQVAFDNLKHKLISSPILAMPIDDAPYILDTDASHDSIGAILSQIQDGEERVIAYASRTLNKPEKNYCVTRKELLAIVFYMKSFRQYLLGRKFQVRTDHAALQFLMRTPTPLGQKARWLDALGEFDFSVIHRPGRVHQNADALSRRPCPQCGEGTEEAELNLCAVQLGVQCDDAEHPWSIAALAAATSADVDLSVVKSWFETGTEKPPWTQVVSLSAEVKTYWFQWDRLKLEQGVLYRKWYSTDGLFERWQLILPSGLRQQCLELAHTGRTGGHMGSDRTAKQVQQRAFWTSWSKDTRQFVRACPDCACYLRSKAPRQGFMQAAPVGEPWERISIDICGEFPTSRSGNRYILTVLDLFSRWAESFPIRNHEASTVARVLSEQVFSRFGIPKQILSDRGAEFESTLMRELCQALGIDKLRTTSYKPSTNGAVERFHRTLNAMLAKTVEPNQT